MHYTSKEMTILLKSFGVTPIIGNPGNDEELAHFDKIKGIFTDYTIN